VAVTGLSSAAVAAPAAAPVPALSGAEQAFALDLLHRLAPGRPNLVLSPSSIATLLAMLEPGAAGPTEAGIAQALSSAAMSPQQQARAWRSLNATLSRQAASDHVVLDTANQLWLQSGFPVRSSYLGLLAADFAAGVREQDLDSDPAGSARAIDSWVAARTAGHITNLLTASELQDVVAVLVDAVYMDAPWQTPFDPSLTTSAPFHVAAGTTTDVPMMSTSHPLDVPVSATADLDAAELPYKGDDMSAVVLMPPIGRLGRFESQLTPAGLSATVLALQQERADIKLPRFRLATSLRLNQVLSDMGMGQAFTPEADFSALSPRSLDLSFVVHDAQMNVSEKGTEASAATGGGLTPTAMPAPPPVTIVFDHPFLFLVRDNATGAVIFEAQLTDPSSPEG
jgi:serpin B